MGTISQLENRNFERSFDLSGSYPTIQHVSFKLEVMMVFVSNPLIDRRLYDQREDPDGYSSTDASPLGSRLPLGLLGLRSGLGMEHPFERSRSL